MRFKLDENFGTRTLQTFQAAGHDASTVHREGLSGCTDRQLFEARAREGRCLVTLDLDFSDVTRFAPAAAAGIVVIRLPRRPTLPVMEQVACVLLSEATKAPLAGQLWIVEPGRIRIHQDEGEPEGP